MYLRTDRTRSMPALPVRAALAGLAALALSTPAAAQMRAAAAATGFQYTLADLAPGDGIAASAEFAPDRSYRFSSTVIIDHPTGVDEYRSESQTSATPYAYVRDHGPEIRMGALHDGTGLAAAVRFDPLEASYGEASTGAALSPWAFRLAPHTAITFTVDMAISASLAEGAPATESGNANALLYLLGTNESGTRQQLAWDGLRAWVGSDHPFDLGSSFDVARTVSVGWRNDSDAWFDGEVYYTVSALAQVSPVPEPGTWALLLAGMGTLAGLVRRRSPSARQ